MRIFIIATLVCLLNISCVKISDLNKRIYKSQKSHLKESQFNVDQFLYRNIKKQTKIRDEFLISFMNELNKNDTLILLENYPRQCIDCISTDYEILFKDKIYFYDFYKNLNFIPVDTVEFQTIKGSMSDTIFSSAIEEFRYLNKKGLLDLSKLKELGTDSCLGGANKMVTIITGNGDIKSYYVKCFLSQEQRFYYQKY